MTYPCLPYGVLLAAQCYTPSGPSAPACYNTKHELEEGSLSLTIGRDCRWKPGFAITKNNGEALPFLSPSLLLATTSPLFDPVSTCQLGGMYILGLTSCIQDSALGGGRTRVNRMVQEALSTGRQRESIVESTGFNSFAQGADVGQIQSWL